MAMANPYPEIRPTGTVKRRTVSPSARAHLRITIHPGTGVGFTLILGVQILYTRVT
jgi:hypothetical protein